MTSLEKLYAQNDELLHALNQLTKEVNRATNLREERLNEKPKFTTTLREAIKALQRELGMRTPSGVLNYGDLGIILAKDEFALTSNLRSHVYATLNCAEDKNRQCV